MFSPDGTLISASAAPHCRVIRILITDWKEIKTTLKAPILNRLVFWHIPVDLTPRPCISEILVTVRLFICSSTRTPCTLTENGFCLLHDCVPQKYKEVVRSGQFEILSALSSAGKGLASRLYWTESTLYPSWSLSLRLLSFYSNYT